MSYNLELGCVAVSKLLEYLNSIGASSHATHVTTAFNTFVGHLANFTLPTAVRVPSGLVAISVVNLFKKLEGVIREISPAVSYSASTVYQTGTTYQPVTQTYQQPTYTQQTYTQPTYTQPTTYQQPTYQQQTYTQPTTTTRSKR
jgi:hypothetical protein